MATRNVRSIPSGGLTATIVDVSGTSALTLLAAVAAKKLIIVSCELWITGGGTLILLDGSTALTPAIAGITSIIRERPVVTTSGIIPWKETSAGEAFKATLGTSGTIVGEIVWFATAQT